MDEATKKHLENEINALAFLLEFRDELENDVTFCAPDERAEKQTACDVNDETIQLLKDDLIFRIEQL